MSVRPAVRAVVSLAASNGSPWTRIVGASATSPPGHWREEGDLARAGDRCVVFDMGPIDGGTDSAAVLEGVGIFLAAGPEPGDHVADRGDIGRRCQLFLCLADPLAHPGEIQGFHLEFTRPRRA